MHTFSLAILATTAVLAVPPSLSAQTLIAHYPLATDLADVTKKHLPLGLNGNPTPPAKPNNGVCVNGIYLRFTNGQDVRSPIMSTLDHTDFQIAVDFKLNAYPTQRFPGDAGPILMAGHSFRWLGFYVDPKGIYGLKHNNRNLVWSTSKLELRRWYVGLIKFEKGNVRLYLDGKLVQSSQIGALNHGGNKNFTTNDFSNGQNLNGCIRNFRVWNNTTLDAGFYTRFVAGCGLQIQGSGTPTIGKTSILAISQTNSAPLGFLVGVERVEVPFCAGKSCLIGLEEITAFSGSRLPLQIPSDNTLVGLVVLFQGVAVANTGCFNLSLSDTLGVTVGK